MTDFILINSKTRMAVLLPFHTESADGHPVTVVGFGDDKNIFIKGLYDKIAQPRPPLAFGLELITEADFMAERE